MAKVKQKDVRPGDMLWDAWQPYVLEPYESRMNVVQRVSFTAGAVHVETPEGPPENSDPEADVVVTERPPRVLMSWDEEHQLWAILVDTRNGSGHSRLNIALNDAELFDGCTDAEEPEPVPKLVRAGVMGPGGFYYPPCPECGQPQTRDHMAEAHGAEPERCSDCGCRGGYHLLGCLAARARRAARDE